MALLETHSLQRHLVLIFITGFIFVLLSCTIFGTDSDSEIQNFPNKVGNFWMYDLKSGTDTTGTIKVEIVGKDTLSNGQFAKQWKYTYPDNYIDTLWVVSSDTAAIFYSDSDGTLRNVFRYKFPLEAGSVWDVKTGNADTLQAIKVVSRTRVTVPAGSFDSSYKIIHSVKPAFNSVVQDTIWYKNQIGPVKKIQHQYNLGPVPGNGTWSLRSYDLQ